MIKTHIRRTDNPYRERVLAYGRSLGMKSGDRKMEYAIRNVGGLERKLEDIVHGTKRGWQRDSHAGLRLGECIVLANLAR